VDQYLYHYCVVDPQEVWRVLCSSPVRLETLN
jgi:hypothetical protein